MEQFGTAIDDEDADGADDLMMAVANCFGLDAVGLDSEQLLTLMWGCYRSVLEREALDVETVEAEWQNRACVSAINAQLALLGQVEAGG